MGSRAASVRVLFFSLTFLACAGSGTPGTIAERTPEPELPTADCAGDVFLNSQAAVDTFGCEEVNGSLIIGGPHIENLRGLRTLRRIDSELIVGEAANLSRLDGLESLESLGSELDIRFNPRLANIDGLRSLREAGHIRIAENRSLTNVDGLAQLESLDGRGYRGVWIESNVALASVEGLAGLAVVPGEIRLNNNPAMTNVDGLRNVTEANSGMSLRDNATLSSLEGLASFTSLKGWLRIARNPQLGSVAGLERLATVRNLEIADNPVLQNLDGLETLLRVEGTLEVQRNQELLDVDGLSGVAWIGGALTVTENPKLTGCEAGLRALLDSGRIAGAITILRNGKGCSSVAEILRVRD